MAYENKYNSTKMIDMSLEEAAEEFAEGEWDGVAVDTDGNPLYAQDEIEYTFKAGAQWGAEHLRDSTKMIGKSMEEAAEISFDEADALTEDYMNFLAKGLTENKPRPIGPHWFSEYAKKRFIAGAEWQKSQMLKDAFMDNYVVHDGRIELEGDPLPSLDPILLLPYPQFKPGDKVKVIVLKDNEDESE